MLPSMGSGRNSLTGRAMENKDSRPSGVLRPGSGREQEIRWLTDDQQEHPATLLGRPEVPSPIAVLGRILPADRNAVAVVGTRSASQYGEAVARRLARALARRGVTLVSGGAYGIDRVSHEAALQAGGRTIAVLGEGLAAPHSASDPELLARIAESGAVISEFSLTAPPKRWQFPRRNRTIAAMAERVVVIEAPEQSGALITAEWARKLQRPVFAVPGPIDLAGTVGPHRLIREGAALLDDIEAFVGRTRPGPGCRAQPGPVAAELLGLLRGGATSVDDVAAALGIAAPAAAIRLLELELLGEVRRQPGGLYEAAE